MKLEIGDEIICIKTTATGYVDHERLILGESYIIEDIDFHFPGKVCVRLKGPYYKHSLSSENLDYYQYGP